MLTGFLHDFVDWAINYSTLIFVHNSVSCMRASLSSGMSVLLTSLSRLKASVKATSNIPIPWANSLSRCSRKCWEKGKKKFGWETLRSWLQEAKIINRNRGHYCQTNRRTDRQRIDKVKNISPKIGIFFTHNIERRLSLDLPSVCLRTEMAPKV